MIFFKKRQNERELIEACLRKIRLEADLLAVEARLRECEPKEAKKEGTFFRKIVDNVAVTLGNEVRRVNTVELSTKREKARSAINTFCEENASLDLSLSESYDKLRDHMDKHLFKKDKSGLEKRAFALSLILTDKHEYMMQTDSLEAVSEAIFDDKDVLPRIKESYEENYSALLKKYNRDYSGGFLAGVAFGSVFSVSVIPVIFTGTFTLIERALIRQNAKKAICELNPAEMRAMLALDLTLVSEARRTLPDEKLSELIDELLVKVQNLRSDAEYKRFAERADISASVETKELCDLALEQLARIIGV